MVDFMELPFAKKRCIVCEKEFLPHTGNQRLCSDKCRIERRKVYAKASSRKDYFREYQRKWGKRRRADCKHKALLLLGNQCFLCGSPQIIFHNKTFVNHYHDDCYVLRHVENFVALCAKCHSGVHFLNRIFGLSWEQILSLKK